MRAPILFVLWFSACGDGPPSKNVLLLTLDTTRADHLGCYGRSGDPTPNLDRLAEEGTRFELAISSASVTPVSHATILSGRANHEHGLRVLTAAGGYRLPDDVPTLATLLAAVGYETGAIHSAFPVSSYFGLDTGFEHFDEVVASFEPDGDGAHVEWDVERFQRRSDETSDRVIELLENVHEPFFLWVHYWDPHDGGKRPPDTKRGGGYVQLYAEEVAYMDRQIGRVLDHLESSGLSEDTLVAVVADHGQGLGDHGWSGHRTLHQEQIRVPLIVSIPGREQVPVVTALVGTRDLAPTVLEALGLPLPRGMTGTSLLPLLAGREDPPRLAFADQINRFDENARMVEERPEDDFLYCAMDAEWKLIYRPTRPERSELYHIGEDPREQRNLHEERPDQVLRLLRALAAEAPWVTEPFAAIDDAEREAALDALAALGYAEGSGDSAATLEWKWLCPDPQHTEVRGEPGQCAECAGALIPRGDYR